MPEDPQSGTAGVYRQVAELHVSCIEGGFLRELGPAFLALMYQAIDEADGSVLLVAREQARVVGFIAGGRGMRSIYRHMLRRWPRLLLALIPKSFSFRRLRRIFDILFYGQTNSSAGLPQAELLAIGVDAAFRGRGHAQQLYRELCADFYASGHAEFKIVVGDRLAGAHRFYQRMGAMPLAHIEVHKGESSTIYVQTRRDWCPAKDGFPHALRQSSFDEPCFTSPRS